jgi:betaine-aldehyde dehydrogenase
VPELRELANFVAGQRRPTRGGVTTPVIDPRTGEAIARAPVTSAADLDDAFAAAAAAFETWRDTTPAERSRALLKIADALEARGEELLAAEVGDTVVLKTAETTPSSTLFMAELTGHRPVAIRSGKIEFQQRR